MRFRVIEEQAGRFSTVRLCRVMGVSSRGLRAFRSRPANLYCLSRLIAFFSYALDALDALDTNIAKGDCSKLLRFS